MAAGMVWAHKLEGAEMAVIRRQPVCLSSLKLSIIHVVA